MLRAGHDHRRERLDLRLLLAGSTRTFALLRLTTSTRCCHERRGRRRSWGGRGRIPVHTSCTGWTRRRRFRLALLLSRTRCWSGLVHRTKRADLGVRWTWSLVGEDDNGWKLRSRCGHKCTRWHKSGSTSEARNTRVRGHWGKRRYRGYRRGESGCNSGRWRQAVRNGGNSWRRGKEGGGYLGDTSLVEWLEQTDLVVHSSGVQRYERRRRGKRRWRFLRLCTSRSDFNAAVMKKTKATSTYASGSSLIPPLPLPLRSRLGTVRLDRPNSSAIPSSFKPKKSSPKESAKLPLRDNEKCCILRRGKITHMTNSPSSSSSSIRKRASSSHASSVVCRRHDQ